LASSGESPFPTRRINLARFSSGKKPLTAVAAAFIAASIVGVPSPAQAGTCSTPGCGGEATNASTRGIMISNNWCSAAGTITYTGEFLPTSCVPVANRQNGYTHPASFTLQPGRRSNEYPKYYDTDAIRLPANCVTNVTIDGNGVQYDRRGISTHQWRKFSNSQTWVVTGIYC